MARRPSRRVWLISILVFFLFIFYFRSFRREEDTSPDAFQHDPLSAHPEENHERVGAFMREARKDMSTEGMTWERRHEIASALCRVSRKDDRNRLCSPGARADAEGRSWLGRGRGQDTLSRSMLGYEVAPKGLAKKITAVLPASIKQMEFLVNFGLSLRLQNRRPSDLFDAIWIVVPASQVNEVFETLRDAHALDPTFLVVPEEVIVPERQEASKHYEPWFLQQEIKLMISVASRTDFYLTLDADVMVGKPITYETLFLPDGRARTTSARAERFWGWASGNFNRTCFTMDYNCEDITDDTILMAFTPIILHAHVVYALARDLQTKHDTAEWMKWLIERRIGPRLHPGNIIPLWTEFILYWLFATKSASKPYAHFHFPVLTPEFDLLVREDKGEIEAYFSRSVKKRPPFINVDDNRDGLDIGEVRRQLLEGIAKQK